MKAVSRTVVQIKPGKKNDVDEFMSQRIEEISSIKGLINWGYMYSDENEITVIALYENKDSADKATPHVNTILGDVAPLVAAQPVRNIFDMNWY